MSPAISCSSAGKFARYVTCEYVFHSFVYTQLPPMHSNPFLRPPIPANKSTKRNESSRRGGGTAKSYVPQIVENDLPDGRFASIPPVNSPLRVPEAVCHLGDSQPRSLPDLAEFAHALPRWE